MHLTNKQKIYTQCEESQNILKLFNLISFKISTVSAHKKYNAYNAHNAPRSEKG